MSSAGSPSAVASTPQSTSTLASGAGAAASEGAGAVGAGAVGGSAAGASVGGASAGGGSAAESGPAFPVRAAVSGGMVEDSTTLDLSELDPGFRTRTRIAS